MQSFKISLGMDIRAVVPEGVLENARREAKSPDAPQYMKELDAKYPSGDSTDDDEFMLGILIAHIRGSTRAYLRANLESKGIGGKLSPISATRESLTPNEQDADLVRPLPVRDPNGPHKAKAVLLRGPDDTQGLQLS